MFVEMTDEEHAQFQAFMKEKEAQDKKAKADEIANAKSKRHLYTTRISNLKFAAETSNFGSAISYSFVREIQPYRAFPIGSDCWYAGDSIFVALPDIKEFQEDTIVVQFDRDDDSFYLQIYKDLPQQIQNEIDWLESECVRLSNIIGDNK